MVYTRFLTFKSRRVRHFSFNVAEMFEEQYPDNRFYIYTTERDVAVSFQYWNCLRLKVILNKELSEWNRLPYQTRLPTYLSHQHLWICSVSAISYRELFFPH